MTSVPVLFYKYIDTSLSNITVLLQGHRVPVKNRIRVFRPSLVKISLRYEHSCTFQSRKREPE